MVASAALTILVVLSTAVIEKAAQHGPEGHGVGGHGQKAGTTAVIEIDAGKPLHTVNPLYMGCHVSRRGVHVVCPGFLLFFFLFLLLFFRSVPR